LIDGHGIIMDMPPGAQNTFSFPVVMGTSESEPLSTRAARMKIYNQLVRQLDQTGAHHSHQLSEVDLSDPDDVKVMVADPKGTVLVHLGAANFLERFKVYVAHIQEWRSQFARVDSIDLRYDGQVIMNPDSAASRARQSGALFEEPKTPEPPPPAKATVPKKTSSVKKAKKH